jgi:vancomycin resistance protein VanJ
MRPQQSAPTSRLDRMRSFLGSRLRSIRISRVDALAVVPATLVGFVLLAAIVPPRSGPLALVMVLEPQLFIAVILVVAPIALLARARLLVAVLAVVVIAGGGLFGSEWISLPDGAGRHDLTVMSWNLQFGTRTPAETAAQLETVDVDLIALQELEPAASAAIETDAAITARYPYRTMAPRPRARGVAILSRYPTAQVLSADNPARLELVVATPRGPVRVINGHPMPGSIDTVTPLRLPIDFDPSDRDAAIATIRGWIDPALERGERLLVLGDYNTSPAEPEYAVLTRGLRDTHVEVGEGPGWTWRPSRIDFLPIGLLRIDLQLTAGALLPSSTSIDCSLPGDHCRLFGTYEIDT